MFQNEIQDIKDEFPALFEGGCACNFGCPIEWKEILRNMCAHLTALGDPDLRLVQVKEKFGHLRVYTNKDTKEINAITDNAEDLAGAICPQYLQK